MNRPVVVIDVGNTRSKWGLFREGKLVSSVAMSHGIGNDYDQQGQAWHLEELEPHWCLASVNRTASDPILDWIARQGGTVQVVDNYRQIPIVIELERPELVGVDRLLNAVAANQRRAPDQAALIVDCGSAITVDVVSRHGAFCGGSIAPGLALSARALHEFTQGLPLVQPHHPDQAWGRTTHDAITCGLVWGTVGMIRELVGRAQRELGGQSAIYLTGGDAVLVAALLDMPLELFSEMTLWGLYIGRKTTSD